MPTETAPTTSVSPVVEDAPYLNCDNAHLTALLQFYGVTDPSGPVACQWAVALDPARPLVPATLRAPVLEAIAAETGLVFRREQIPLDRYWPWADAVLAEGTPFIAYGESSLMPWLPYFGNEVGAHPVIVEGREGDDFVVVEAYTNVTPWGPVVPGRYRVPVEEMRSLVHELDPRQRGEVIVLDGRTTPAPRSVTEHLRDNAASILATVRDESALAVFAERGRASVGDVAAMQQFDLGCWELARARGAHAVWLRRLVDREPTALPVGIVERFEQQIAAAWRKASQFAFVASQRAQREVFQVPASCDLIEVQIATAEAELAAEMLDLTRRAL